MIDMSNVESDYAAYLLRLRRSDEGGQVIWRASLESAHDASRLEFGNLEALITFLRDRFGRAEQAGERKGGDDSSRFAETR
jgi:hypothetical protein